MRESDLDLIELPQEALADVAGGNGCCIDPLG